MKKALVINLNDFGDIILSTPFIRNLNENGYEVDVVADSCYSKALEGNKRVSKVFELDRNKIRGLVLAGDIEGALNEARKLTEKLAGYDYSFNLHGSTLSGIIQACAQAEKKAGLIIEQGRRIIKNAYWFYASLRGRDEKQNNRFHAVALFNSMLHYAGIEAVDYTPEYFARDDSFSCGENDVILHIGNGAAIKKWPDDYFVETAKMLKSEGFNPVITGGMADKEKAEKISREAECVYDCSLTIPQMASALKKCAMLITTDTGILHLASALGTKTVAVFGPTSAYETGGFSESCLMIQSKTHCSPCFRERCPSVKCMRSVTPNQVAEAVKGRGDLIKIEGIGEKNIFCVTESRIVEVLKKASGALNADVLREKMKEEGYEDDEARALYFASLVPALKVAPSELVRR